MLVETLLALSALLVSLTRPNIGSHLFERIESLFRSVARRRALAVLLISTCAVTMRLLVLPIFPTPVPRVDDEYSHLLLADTLLHGRLANPTPAMWVHLEVLEVIMRPTYSSVYPPMQGLFLATGRLLSGSPFVGVVLSVAIMCGSIVWMLQGFMPAEWALLGGSLAVMRFAVFSYWAGSYMGGAPAAIGGALAVGAFFRIKREPGPRNATILGLGISILGHSRPYEGFVLSLVIGIALLWWWLGLSNARRHATFIRAFLPLFLILVITGSATCYYYWRVTGNPLLTPYQLVWKTYGMVPKFLWQRLGPPQESGLRHDALAHYFYTWEMQRYLKAQTLNGLLDEWGVRAVINWGFYLGPLLSMPLIVALATAPYGFRRKHFEASTQFVLVSIVIMVAALAVVVFSYPHYAAPITCLIIALVVLSIRQLRTQRVRGKMFGLCLSRAIPVLSLVVLIIRAAAGPLHIPLRPSFMPSIYNSDHEKVSGNLIQEHLQAIPGQHLVMVRYPRGSDSDDWMGWVHNEADIDHSRIVWAWDMGAEKNRELVDYFRGRRAWMVDAGVSEPQLKPYQ
jgi:hypothetical protein